MPATTPILALPYPVAGDPDNVPADLQALAVAVEGPRVAQTPTVVPLVVKGASSHTSNLSEWQNSAGATIAAVTAGGAARFTAANQNHRFGPGTADTDTTVSISNANPSAKGLAVRAAAAQSSNLLECQDSAGNVRAGFDAIGRYILNANLDGNPIGTYAGRLHFIINGELRYVPFYS